MSDLSPETRAMLARGRAGHALPEGRRKGMKRALLVRIAGGTLVASTTSATALAGKVVAVAILVGAFSAGVANVVESRSAARPPAPVSVPAAAPIAQAGPPRGSWPAPPLETPPAAPEPAATAVRRPARATPVATIVTPPVVAAVDAPVSAAPPSSAPPFSAPSLQAEVTLLLEAHRALHAGDPDTALRLLGEHAARFPGSALAPERSAERILALCRAGRNEDARLEGQAFLAAGGSGPLALRVQRSCAGGGE